MKRPPLRPTLLALALAIVAPSPAAAAPGTPVDAACTSGGAEASVAVAAVADDLAVTLADGRILRLAGLDVPRATAANPDLPARARKALEAWLAAAPDGLVTLKAPSVTPDRWGRIDVLLTRAGAEPAGAADMLLGAGLARVKPEAAIRGCVPAWLGAEAAARARGLGLWADPHYALLGPGDAAGLAGQAGGLALVQGLLRLHDSRGTLYLTLGRDRWGFTAVVSRRDAARFAKAGLDLDDYVGTPVRLRGDLDMRFGPRLRLTEPEAVESLEPGSIVEAAEDGGHGGPKHWTMPPPPR